MSPLPTTVRHGVRVLVLPAEGPSLAGEADAVEVLGHAFAQRADVVAVPVARLHRDFFRLASGTAGAVVQKFVTYGVRLVVVGPLDHHGPPTGPVAEWVREANCGRELWFVADSAELDDRLAALR